MSKKLNALRLCAAMALGAAIVGASPSSVGAPSGPRLPTSGGSTPAGFDHVLLYMGNGIFEPNSPAPRPGFTNCIAGFCDGAYFQKYVAKRTDAQIAQQVRIAKAFFKKRFGIDVDSPANAGRVSFRMFTFHPDLEYRLYLSSNMPVSPDGWIVRDGGWKLEITDPRGYDLGGETPGLHAKKGDMMFYGDYNILVTDSYGNPRDEIVITYKSRTPAMITSTGMTFLCDMYNKYWGPGIGMGSMQLIPTSKPGVFRANVRNAITFPPSSRVINFPEYPGYGDHPPGK